MRSTILVLLLAGCCPTGEPELLIADDSPLYPCPGRTISETPQVGLCSAGFFPDVDFTCGPSGTTADGGSGCSCHQMGTQVCRKRCNCDTDCSVGQGCALIHLFWGSDIPTTHEVKLCR